MMARVLITVIIFLWILWSKVVIFRYSLVKRWFITSLIVLWCVTSVDFCQFLSWVLLLNDSVVLRPLMCPAINFYSSPGFGLWSHFIVLLFSDLSFREVSLVWSLHKHWYVNIDLVFSWIIFWCFKEAVWLLVHARTLNLHLIKTNQFIPLLLHLCDI